LNASFTLHQLKRTIPLLLPNISLKRPQIKSLKNSAQSAIRVLESSKLGEHYWFGEDEKVKLNDEDQKAYGLAHTIQRHLIVQAPLKHKSGHPGGPLSAFTFSYFVYKRRNPQVDQPYRMSAGHLSLLSYGLQYCFGRDNGNKHLQSPQGIIDAFRTPDGLPGHIEAGVGDTPFGTGPLGKGVSNALGVAFGLKYQKKPGIVDVLLADGDGQEGQVMEAFRLAAHLETDNLIVHGDFNDMQLGDMPSKTVWADFASIAYAAGWHVIEVENGNDPLQVIAAQNKADELVGKGKPIFVCYYTTMGHGIDFMEEGSDTGSKNFHGSPLSEKEAEDALGKLMPLEEAVKEYEPFYKSEKKKYESAPPVETDILIDFNLSKRHSSLVTSHSSNTKGRETRDERPATYKRTITSESGAARKDFGAVHIKSLMAVDDRIIVLHADIAGSGGFNKVEADFPNRVINVGVAEANMLMMAAGMRQTGLLPVTYTFAAFNTNEARANARLIDINCGHTRCGIINDGTHAGTSVGEDGETHQEQSYLTIPYYHTQVWMSADSNQAGAMAERSVEIIAEGHESVYTFFPRSSHEQIKTPDGEVMYGPDYVFDGKANLVRGSGDTSDNVTIIATGNCVHDAIGAAEMAQGLSQKINVRVLNVSCVRPIDSSAIVQAALETGHLIVVEDHNIDGGLATQVADIIADFALPCSLRRLGLNQYFPSAKADELKLFAGIDADSILDAVEDETRTEVCGGEDAFVTSIHELTTNIDHSKFAENANDFIKKLINEKGYMESLREYWGGRACPEGKLPSNEDLIKKLKS
jgi:transketolase|tara:strand:- start:2346 stop:4769 length:2424 start_codon:yes stop_codon:yes gene_type:complete